ncbi:5-methylcytosine-specific restriction enzyme A [Gammaproteobacteria bacterium]
MTTQSEIVIEFFEANSGRDIQHPKIVDWVTVEYKKRTGKVFRDPDRQIRMLHQKGFLIKIAKGVYKYDPDFVEVRELENFTEGQKKEILERDGFRCVICGKGGQSGIELQVDHIKPKDKGGKATIENSQTLCAAHNFRKKNYQQTETGKKMFIRLYDLAKSIDDQETMIFCTQILEVFEKNNVNGHIVWKR